MPEEVERGLHMSVEKDVFQDVRGKMGFGEKGSSRDSRNSRKARPYLVWFSFALEAVGKIQRRKNIRLERPDFFFPQCLPTQDPPSN